MSQRAFKWYFNGRTQQLEIIYPEVSEIGHLADLLTRLANGRYGHRSVLISVVRNLEGKGTNRFW
jgi:hypothetical protein